MTLTKNASFRSYGTFSYLLRAHIHNINMRMYITSARGHELSGRVCSDLYNYYKNEKHFKKLTKSRDAAAKRSRYKRSRDK